MKPKLLLPFAALLLAGCSDRSQVGRYTFRVDERTSEHLVVWRMDSQTGRVEALAKTGDAETKVIEFAAAASSK